MSETVIFRDDVSVELIKSSASDADVIWAARVSTAGELSLDEIGEDPARSAGLINYLARERHGSPFEHTSMTFFISAPIFVFREFMRHRAPQCEDLHQLTSMASLNWGEDAVSLLFESDATSAEIFTQLLDLFGCCINEWQTSCSSG